jgi:hypothetical protein
VGVGHGADDTTATGGGHLLEHRVVVAIKLGACPGRATDQAAAPAPRPMVVAFM